MKTIECVYQIEHNSKVYYIKFIKRSKFTFDVFVRGKSGYLIHAKYAVSYGVVDFETAVLALCEALNIDYNPKQITP